MIIVVIIMIVVVIRVMVVYGDEVLFVAGAVLAVWMMIEDCYLGLGF